MNYLYLLLLLFILEHEFLSLKHVEMRVEVHVNYDIEISDAILARVETEKRMSLIRAWEDSVKTKAENR